MKYLGTPYSHPSGATRHYRFCINEEITADYLTRGIFIYSPIVHHHEMARKYSLPKDFDFWRNHDFNMIHRSDGLIALTLPGWETSKGLTDEIEYACSIGLEVEHLAPYGRCWDLFKKFL